MGPLLYDSLSFSGSFSCNSIPGSGSWGLNGVNPFFFFFEKMKFMKWNEIVKMKVMISLKEQSSLI